MKKIFVIILNWNGWQMTLDCLKSLEKIKINEFRLEIVIVDNGSTDDSVGKLKTTLKSLKLIENKKNLGFAEGNNVGVKHALENGADFVCLLNNDTRVDPNFLVELIRTAESDEKIGIVGGKIYFEKGFEFHKNGYLKNDLGKVIWYAGGKIDWKNVIASHKGVDEVDRGQFEITEETAYISGCLMLIKKEVFKKIGLFDPKYFLYYEENDFCQRAKRAGFKLFFEPKSVIWHLNAGSSGVGSNLQEYFTSRNRLLFGMKFAPMRSKIALIKEGCNLLFSGREWQKRGVRDFFLSKYGNGSWGK